jgi:hypothetical protein
VHLIPYALKTEFEMSIASLNQDLEIEFQNKSKAEEVKLERAAEYLKSLKLQIADIEKDIKTTSANLQAKVEKKSKERLEERKLKASRKRYIYILYIYIINL